MWYKTFFSITLTIPNQIKKAVKMKGKHFPHFKKIVLIKSQLRDNKPDGRFHIWYYDI